MYYGLCYFFPPPGSGISEKLKDGEPIDGVEVGSSASSSAVDVGRKEEMSEKVMQV